MIKLCLTFLLCFTFYKVLSLIILVKMAEEMIIQYAYRGFFFSYELVEINGAA